MNPLICSAVNIVPSMLAVQSVPSRRLTERIVRPAPVTRSAAAPASATESAAKATTDGVAREPSAFAMTVGLPPSMMATTQRLVPRSIPTARATIPPPKPPADKHLTLAAESESPLGKGPGRPGYHGPFGIKNYELRWRAWLCDGTVD